MDAFKELIQLSTQTCDYETLKTYISEEDAMKEGKKRIVNQQFDLNDNQIEIMIHDFSYPIIRQIFDSSTGYISKFGNELIQSTEGINSDLTLLLTYFQKYKRQPNFDDVANEKLDPLTYYKFTEELFDSFSTIPKNDKDNRNSFSQIIKKVLVSSKDLSLSENIQQLNEKVIEISNLTDGSNTELFKPIFEDCLTRAFLHDKVPSENLGDLVSRLLDLSFVDTKMIDDLNKKFKNSHNPIDTIRSLEQFLNIVDTQWVYSEKEAPDMIGDVKAKTISMIQKIGTLINGKATIGFVSLKIKVDWEKKFEDTRFSNSAFIEVNSYNTKQVYDLNKNKSIDIYIPIFGKESEKVEVSLCYIKDKFKQSKREKVPKDGIGRLTSLSFKLSTKSDKYESKFKRRSGGISPKCGSLIIKTEFSDIDKIVPVNSELKYIEPNMDSFLSFLISCMVKDWVISGSTMSLSPPIETHLALLEYAVRYSIPASTIYLRIANALSNCWCHAEGFLDAFTTIFLCAHIAMNAPDAKITEKEEQMYNYLCGFIEKNAKIFMIQHLSKPALYERHGLRPLFILLSFSLPQEQIYFYIDQLIEKSHENIMNSITSELKPVPSDKPVSAADDLLSYCTKSDKQMNDSNDSDNDGGFKKGKYTFTVGAISEACSYLVCRSKQLKAFYEDSCLPTFLDQWVSLNNDLKNYALCLLKMFISLNTNDCTDTEIFKFIFSYREMYTFFSFDNEYTPYKVFLPVIMDWIGRTGEKMIEWTNNAIKFDPFIIDNPKQRTSSSLSDLMEVFRQSFEFIGLLKWEDSSIEDFVMTFLNMCGSCLRCYTEILIMKILSYFPQYILKEFNDEEINHFIPDIKHFVSPDIESNPVTPKIIFVMINNFLHLRSSWKSFADKVKDQFPAIDFPPQLFNPVPNIKEIAHCIPNLFARLTSHMVSNTVMPHLWIKNSKVKKMLVKKASSHILNPEFFESRSKIYAQIFDSILKYLNARIDEINSTTCISYYMPMIQCFLFGLDSGMMNLLNIGKEDDYIKHKRLIPILNFMHDIYTEVFNHIIKTCTQEKIEFDTLKAFTPYSTFVLRHINEEPDTLLAEAQTITDPNLSLAIFILIASKYNDVKRVREYVNANKTRMIGKKFYPPNYTLSD